MEDVQKLMRTTPGRRNVYTNHFGLGYIYLGYRGRWCCGTFDIEMKERLKQRKWTVSKRPRMAKGRQMYYLATLDPVNRRKTVFMHTYLFGAELGKIKHKDGDGLNNARENLTKFTNDPSEWTQTNVWTMRNIKRRAHSEKWTVRIQRIGKSKQRDFEHLDAAKRWRDRVLLTDPETWQD